MIAATSFDVLTDDPHTKYEASFKNGRWHWHRVVNGEITYGNNVKLRSSARRAILRSMGLEGLREVKQQRETQ